MNAPPLARNFEIKEEYEAGMQIHPFTFTHGWGENFSPKFTYRRKRVKADFQKILGEVRWGETFTHRSPMKLLALKLTQLTKDYQKLK